MAPGRSPLLPCAHIAPADTTAYGGEAWSPRTAPLRNEVGALSARCGQYGEWAGSAPCSSTARPPNWPQLLAPVDPGRATAEHDGLARPGKAFLEPATFQQVVPRLRDPLNDLARLACRSGWRTREVAGLRWPDVDRARRRIVVRRALSKTWEPRVLPLTPELTDLIERRWRAREYQTSDGRTALSEFVFPRQGRMVKDFRKAWRTATEKACGTRSPGQRQRRLSPSPGP